MSRGAGWVLAFTATGTALCLSVLAGWQRGGTLAERLVWIAIGMVLVACAHLLPALVRQASIGIRSAALVLWLACMAAAGFGHATVFLLAQRHAGELRASAVPVAEAAPAGRSLTAVMAERADVVARLATVTAQRCAGNCTTLEARRVTLTARLDALDAEALDVRRQMAERDRATTERDARLADPVTARLAALLGTTAARMELLSALAFAAVLEGVACLLWTLALGPQPPEAASHSVVTGSHAPVVAQGNALLATAADATDVTLEPTPAVAQRHTEAAERHVPHDDPVTGLLTDASHDADVTQLAQAVAAGRVRPTVTGIRQFLGCSQARAIALRRQLAVRSPAA
ncbi:hypothetical protein ACS7SF_09970 [Ralstonia sp. 25C]|uniref:hypothetical protein n=1 Tax=Ralstonia sp. 25C TaxID=3447363 RepID=UPI003F7549FC